MAKKQTTAIGIEYDNLGIRAAEVTATPRGKDTQFNINKLEEFSGNITKDEDLIKALKKVRDKISPGKGDRIVSCVSGKQLYSAQLPFKRLPDDEIRNALRFEIRKNLPFEVSGSTIEYQFLGGSDKKGENADILVAAVANILLNRHVRNLEKGGFKPGTVDILPLAAANAFWAAHKNGNLPHANIILHVGPEISSVIIDGEDSTYYHRTIYFSAKELFGPSADPELPMREKERRITGLTDELVRSLSFYETNFHAASFSVVHVLGNFLQQELLNVIELKTGLNVKKLDLVKALNPEMESEAGKYDLAVSLALRE